MLFVKPMTFFLFCLELYNLQMNCEPALMPELLKKFVAVWEPFPQPIPSPFYGEPG